MRVTAAVVATLKAEVVSTGIERTTVEVRRTADVDSLDGVRLLHDANRRFHDGVLAAAHHHRLGAMLARTVDIPLVFQAFTTFGVAEIQRSDTFHHLIVEAMCRRDASRAAALMAEHIAQGRDAVLDVMACRDAGDAGV